MTSAKTDPGSHLAFEPLYYGEKLCVINGHGQIAIVTFWSKVDTVIDILRQAEIPLDQHASPIAVIANLYGDGLPQMLVNLLYNPQIGSLLMLGRNLSDSKASLVGFFASGVTDPDERTGTVRIQGTGRRIPRSLHPGLFPRPPKLVDLGEDLRQIDWGKLRHSLTANADGPYPERVRVELPEVKVTTKPSAAFNHSMVADTPCEAWRELLFVLSEFGNVNKFDTSGGDRLELLDVRVAIRKPFEEADDVLREHGLDLAELKRYQDEMLDPACPADLEYTYGSRLKTHFGANLLEECRRILGDKLGSRHAYISLWDSHRDLRGDEVPCLASLFFRMYDEALTLTATFRVHNAATAWMRNVYGLIRILGQMAAGLSVEVGPLILLSESISLRKNEMPKVLPVIEKYKKSYQHYREDPNGHFEITLDGDRIVLIQRSEGLIVNRFEGTTGRSIEYEVGKAHAISEISHALYLGRELAKAEDSLRTGKPYVQA